MNEIYNPTVLMVPVYQLEAANTLFSLTSILINALKPEATVIAYAAPQITTSAETLMEEYVVDVVNATDHRFTTIIIFYEVGNELMSPTHLAMEQNMNICGEALRLPGWPVTPKVVQVTMTSIMSIYDMLRDFAKTNTCMDLFTAVQVNEILRAVIANVVWWTPAETDEPTPMDNRPDLVCNSSDMDHYNQCEAAESM